MSKYCYLCGKLDQHLDIFCCPKDPSIRAKWFTFCEIGKEYSTMQSLRLCEKHFNEEEICRKKTPNGRSKLKKHVEPSLNRKSFRSEAVATDYSNCQLCTRSGVLKSKRPHSSSKVSHFCFPKDAALREKWLLFCELEEEDMSSDPRLCSLHFHPDDIIKHSPLKWGLAAGAVPIIYDIEEIADIDGTNGCEQSFGSVHHEVVIESSSWINESGVEEMIDMVCDENTSAESLADSILDNEPIASRQCFSETCIKDAIAVLFVLHYIWCLMISNGDAQDTLRTPVSNKGNPNTVSGSTPSPNSRATGARRKCRRSLRYIGDVRSPDFKSPGKARKIFEIATITIDKYRKRSILLHKQVSWMQKRMHNYRQIISDLNAQLLISEKRASQLTENLPVSMLQMLERQLSIKATKYPPQLRAFALHLQFLSTKAYEYVRSIWNNLLPHVSTLRRWYSVINGAPGFTKEAFKTLRRKSKKNGKPLACVLVLDEMSIRDTIEVKNGKTYGLENLGTGLLQEDTDFPVTAKHALVFLVVSLKEGWKLPVSYFLINKITGAEKGNLVKICLQMLYDVDVHIVALTFDGDPAHFRMCESLGADFDLTDTLDPKKPYFAHPSNSKMTVFAYPDPCHMVKLVRNTLLDKGVISKGTDSIQWSDIKSLRDLEKREGLRSTRLTNKHIDPKNNKMNVRLAVQTLSASVGNTLQYLQPRNTTFENCTATSEFCLIMNQLFDVLNVRSKFNRLVLDDSTKHSIRSKFDKITAYVKSLSLKVQKMKEFDTTDFQNEDDSEDEEQVDNPDPLGLQKEAKIPCSYIEETDQILVTTARKTGFLGLIVCMMNLIPIFEEIQKIDPSQTYLLTYKLLQDALENLFSMIRRMGGHNPNPTAYLFEAAYRRLLIHAEIKPVSGGGNCEKDDLDMLEILHATKSIPGENCETDDVEMLQILHATKKLTSVVDPVVRLNSEGTDLDIDDIKGDELPQYESLSEFVSDVVAYIAGYIVRKLLKKDMCLTCSAHLEAYSRDRQPLVDARNFGGLCKASKDVIEVCRAAEQTIRAHSNLRFTPTFTNFVARKTYIQVSKEVFQQNAMREHTVSQELFEEHHHQLIKIIAKIYTKIRVHHEARKMNEKDVYIRQRNNKLTIFAHQ